MPRAAPISPLVLCVLLCGGARTVCGYEIELPPVGTMINFTFNPPEGVLPVASNIASESVFDSTVIFVGDKALRKYAAPDYALEDFIEFTLILRGDGVKSALLDDFRRFDEQASLLRGDGSSLETTENHSYGYDHSDDYFQFSWDFRTQGDFVFHGISWQITPDVAAGLQLPALLSIEAYLWGSPIVVVPEPSGALIATMFLAVSAPRRRAAR